MVGEEVLDRNDCCDNNSHNRIRIGYYFARRWNRFDGKMSMLLKMESDICVRPVHLKFGLALAISAGGILYAFLAIKNKRNTKRSGNDNNGSKPGNGKKSDARGENEDELRQEDLALMDSRRVRSHGSLSDWSSFGSRDGLLLPEFNEVLQECNMALTTASVSPRSEDCGDGHGRGELEPFATNLHTCDRNDMNLEFQKLLECCENNGMDMDPGNRLQLHNMDDTIYNLKIESLVSHNKRLETKLGDFEKLMSELEAEKAKTKILRRKLRAGAEQPVEDILTPRVQSDHDLNINILKEHLEEAMNSYRALSHENLELLNKLEYVKMLATSALETEEMHELRAESQRLRQQNDELMKEVERMQAERWIDVEELVYLRWINACLRYEESNHKTNGGKSISGDAKKMLSPKSQDRLKQIIMESAYKNGSISRRMDIAGLDFDQCSSSHSCLTDDSSIDTNKADKSKHSSKNKVFSKLKKLLKGKGSSSKTQEPHKRSNSIARTVSLDHIPDGFSSYSDELTKSSRTTSRASSRRSLDLPRSWSRSQKSVSSSSSMRISDVSASLLTRMNSVSEVDEHEWPLEPQPSQDAREELLKYAEALKNSRGSFRRKSTAFESYS